LTLLVHIADRTGASGQGRRQKGVVDAEPVAARAVPGKFAALGIAPPPHIAEPDRLDRIQVMRRRVDRSRLVDIGAAGIEIGDRGKPRSAALPDVPGEEPQHQSAEAFGTARPAISAPASGDMRRKNGTDNSEIAATIANANEKSPGLETALPCIASIR